MPGKAEGNYVTLAQWAGDRSDMRIVCKCGRTINIPSEKIVERFRFAGEVSKAVARLVCMSCRRRGHATITPVPILRS